MSHSLHSLIDAQLFPIPGELHGPGLSLLLQAQCVRGVQRAGHRDDPRRHLRPRHPRLDQDCGHQEEEEAQQPGQGTLMCDGG